MSAALQAVSLRDSGEQASSSKFNVNLPVQDASDGTLPANQLLGSQLTSEEQADSLYGLGTEIFRIFKLLAQDSSDATLTANYLPRSRLITEEQKFRLWAHSLGLHQTGHASLDYRLRDAVVIRNYTFEVLTDLKTNLDDILSIKLGLRQPYEVTVANGGDEELLEDSLTVKEVLEDSASDQQAQEESLRSQSSATSSEGSFHELDFRLKSVSERVDALFSLAVKIRRPANRPTRPTVELYKHVPASQRLTYMHEREQTETDIVAYVQRQLLGEALSARDTNGPTTWQERRSAKGSLYFYNTDTREKQWNKPTELMTPLERTLNGQPWQEHESRKTPGHKYYWNPRTQETVWTMPELYRDALKRATMGFDDLIDTYARPDYWLVQRAGLANARRKQQFVYWKEHAYLIGRDLPNNPVRPTETKPLERTVEIRPPVIQPDVTLGVQSVVPEQRSMATSATKLDPNAVKLDDLTSVITHQSRVSTVMGPQGEKIEWPMPPTTLVGKKFFTCPYCKTLCPQSYLSKDAWRVHIINDLQPYHCTYPDCADPHRLYSSRKEWLMHENQHTRVWRCAADQKEFETRPEYMAHLGSEHTEEGTDLTSPELVDAVVDASAKTHRDCPFCPTAFVDVTQMHKHITYHLERLALFALPGLDDQGAEEEDRSERSSDSQQAIRQKKGRQGSVVIDFANEAKLAITEDYNRGGPDEWIDQEPSEYTALFQGIRDTPEFQSTPTLDEYIDDWLAGKDQDREQSQPSWYTREQRAAELSTDSAEEPSPMKDEDVPPAPSTTAFPDLPFSRDIDWPPPRANTSKQSRNRANSTGLGLSDRTKEGPKEVGRQTGLWEEMFDKNSEVEPDAGYG